MPGAVIARRRGRSDRELLPDDPVRRGAQRDAAGPRGRGRGAGRRKKAWCWSEGDTLASTVAERGKTPPRRPARHRARGKLATIAVLVDNEPGVLARVIGLFSGRGYNIESLTVAEVDRGEPCRASPWSPRARAMIIEQIKAQLRRLVPVHKVRDLTDRRPVCRARTGAGQGGRQRRASASRPAHRRHASALGSVDSSDEQLRLRDHRLDRESSTRSSR